MSFIPPLAASLVSGVLGYLSHGYFNEPVTDVAYTEYMVEDPIELIKMNDRCEIYYSNVRKINIQWSKTPLLVHEKLTLEDIAPLEKSKTSKFDF